MASSAHADEENFRKPFATIIGGGPAGLMAAEVLASGGAHVVIFDRMPSLARKFLMAGRGGLNLTHSEPFEDFMRRYGARAENLRPAIEAFPPERLRAWCEGLGVATFVGSSGRVFPQSLKASPLLRAWLRRLGELGVEVRLRHSFSGWDEEGRILFASTGGEAVAIEADATVLALGGASWPRLGSDGGWREILARRGVSISPLEPANCGFEISWSAHLRERHAGTPLKNIALTFGEQRVRGECVLTAEGIEGGAVYALSARWRDAIARDGEAIVHLDLKPDTDASALSRKLAAPRGKASLANHLRKQAGLSGAALALLHEIAAPFADASKLAAHIKALPLRLRAARPIERAISTAGGVAFSELDENYMLRRIPGVFCAGEMLDWEAPTGGYLLQASFATGVAAGQGALDWLRRKDPTKA